MEERHRDIQEKKEDGEGGGGGGGLRRSKRRTGKRERETYANKGAD